VIRPLHFGVALVAATVAISGWTDVDRYFNKQMHDAAVFAEYSASPTFAARELAKLPASTRVVMDERLIGEPTIQFLAPNAPKTEGYETHLLPLTTPATPSCSWVATRRPMLPTSVSSIPMPPSRLFPLPTAVPSCCTRR